MGSVNSDSMPFPGGSVYALTKGAIASFTRGLARDLGPRGITVNTIQPGPIDTEMNPSNGPAAELMKGFMALKRFGHAEEIAGLVSFLAGAEGARQSLRVFAEVSGGHRVWGERPYSRFLFTPGDVVSRIGYVEGNPEKEGLVRQEWEWVVPYRR